MSKETIGEKEINLSHDISSKINVKKERREFFEYQYHKLFIIPNKKTA
jgi:hypothetical protein